MLVKRYFIDQVYYDTNDEQIYGDMGFTFCDMPETECETLNEAKEDIEFAINEEEDYGETIIIYLIVEYIFDTDKFYRYEDGEVDEDYSIYNSEAIVDNKPIGAMCRKLSNDAFYQRVNKCFKKDYHFDIEMCS